MIAVPGVPEPVLADDQRRVVELELSRYTEQLKAAEKWGDFHLIDEIGSIRVSTMWDGSDRASGPYETCVFGTGQEENPLIHCATRNAAESTHASIVQAYETLHDMGVL